MLAIRLQRTGRSGHTQFRVIVQDSHFSPKRGRVVAYLGSYDPHTKATTIDIEKAGQYLSNGAQPSDRVAKLLQKEGVKLPSWVKLEQPQTGSTRNPDKRKSTRPAEEPAPEPAAETTAEDAPADEPVESPAETAAEDQPAEELATEPAGETASAEPEAAGDDTPPQDSQA